MGLLTDLFGDQFRVPEIRLHLPAVPGAPQEPLQDLPLGFAAFAETKFPRLALVGFLELCLEPVEVFQLSSRCIIVTVHRCDNQPAGMMEHVGMSDPSDEPNAQHMSRRVLLPVAGCIPGTTKAEAELPQLSFLGFLILGWKFNVYVSMIIDHDVSLAKRLGPRGRGADDISERLEGRGKA